MQTPWSESIVPASAATATEILAKRVTSVEKNFIWNVMSERMNVGELL